MGSRWRRCSSTSIWRSGRTGAPWGRILPALTRVAWQINRREIEKEVPGITRKKFLFNLSRASYEKDWGSTYRAAGHPIENSGNGISHRAQQGPFKALGYQALTPETEKLYMAGFNASIDRYRELLAGVKARTAETSERQFRPRGRHHGGQLPHDRRGLRQTTAQAGGSLCGDTRSLAEQHSGILLGLAHCRFRPRRTGGDWRRPEEELAAWKQDARRASRRAGDPCST